MLQEGRKVLLCLNVRLQHLFVHQSVSLADFMRVSVQQASKSNRQGSFLSATVKSVSNTFCWNCQASRCCLTCSTLIACFFCSLSMILLFPGLSQNSLRLASCSIVQNEITWQLVSRTGKAHEHLKASGLVEREAGVTPKILTYHIAYVTARHRALTLPSMKAQNSSLRALRPWQTGVATTLCSLVNNVSNASNQQTD